MNKPFYIVATVLAFLATNIAAQQNKNLRPNIIYIMTDDLGYGDLSCYGQKTIKTPNIDKLAREGIRFTDHYSGNSVCRPSRAVLWTGLEPRNNPVRGNINYALQNVEPTVAKLLKAHGYTTGGVGKWAMANADSGHPNDNGFDFWMGFLDQSAAHNHFPLHLWRNREKVELPGNTVYPTDPVNKGRVSKDRVTYAHDVMTGEAMSFIRRNANTPFLLHVHWTLPHANNEGGRFLGDGMETLSYGQFANKDWPNPEKGFAAMITKIDQDVGRILDLLKELDIDEDTLVFFTSDNGPHQEGGHKHDFFDSNGPLRGYKRDLYEGGIRVPLVARWPNHIKANSTTNHVSAFWDYLPTVCEISHVSYPKNKHSISYAATLLGQEQTEHESLHWIFEGKTETKQAVRSGKWKAIQQSKSSPWELYDLSKDIGETNDVSSKEPNVLAELTNSLN